MGELDVATLREGIAEKYRKVAVSPGGLSRYPTGEAVLGLGCGAGFDAHVAALPGRPRGRRPAELAAMALTLTSLHPAFTRRARRPVGGR